MPGNTDPGDFDLVIDDPVLGSLTIEEFTGLDFEPQQDASFNEGPSGKAFGFNFQRQSNRVSLSLSVRETSKHLADIYDIVEAQRVVKVTATLVRNQDAYDDDQLVQVGAERCVIMPGSTSRGSGEAGDVSFSILGINPIKTRKRDL